MVTYIHDVVQIPSSYVRKLPRPLIIITPHPLLARSAGPAPPPIEQSGTALQHYFLRCTIRITLRCAIALALASGIELNMRVGWQVYSPWGLPGSLSSDYAVSAAVYTMSICFLGPE